MSAIALTASFAAFAGLMGVLTGRLPAAAVSLALSAGALLVAVAATPRLLSTVRVLDLRSALIAAGGGALLCFAAPALVAANRMSDAPSGSVTVFWMSAGWAAVVMLGSAAGWIPGARRPLASAAGALGVLAGAAGVLADWERPSSFSPLIKFPVQESLMLAGGLALLLGTALLARAAPERGDGTARRASLIVACTAAVVLSVVWALGAGIGRIAAALSDQPIALAAAGLAWGVAVLSWTAVAGGRGARSAAACVALTPALLSSITLVEQVVGAAGPQPLILPGVAAGALLLAAAFVVLVRSDARAARSPWPFARWTVWLLVLPPALAAVGLALPAIRADVTARGAAGSFAVSWDLLGASAVAGWAALALALATATILADRRPCLPAVVALAACAAWPALLGVPTHVLTRWLPPDVQQYYGTEYATIDFTRLLNVPLIASVALSAAGLLLAVGIGCRRWATAPRPPLGDS